MSDLILSLREAIREDFYVLCNEPEIWDVQDDDPIIN